MKKSQIKGAKISLNKNLKETIVSILKKMFQNDCCDAILMPMQVPAKDSYAWVLIKDKKLIDDANPIAPVMPVQGAKALSNFSRKGESKLKILAVMKPCEIRAVVELSKLNQINLENITLISYDCPGALSIKNYREDPDKAEKKFTDMLKKPEFLDNYVKSVCKNCDNFSLLPVCDLHVGYYKSDKNNVFLIPNSKRGKQNLEKLNMKTPQDLSEWMQDIEEIRKKRVKNKQERFKQIKNMVEGFDSLRDTFTHCIGCHNCRSACPICYCRQCYFDSESAKTETDMMLLNAEKRGAITFPLDRIIFQVGRMSHMSLSCVSCGLCTDACPVSIPVADIFSYVAENTQKQFGYKSGNDKTEQIPLKTFQLQEVGGIKELVKDAEG